MTPRLSDKNLVLPVYRHIGYNAFVDYRRSCILLMLPFAYFPTNHSILIECCVIAGQGATSSDQLQQTLEQDICGTKTSSI